MRKQILSLAIIAGSFVCQAQEISHLTISYSYNQHVPTGELTSCDMSLQCGDNVSKFFNSINEQVDSMLSTVEGRVAYSQMMQAAMAKQDFAALPVKKEPMYVVKNHKDSTCLVYDLVGTDFWKIEEPLNVQNWVLEDSTKRILGYECFKATCMYNGRLWNAWFAPEIPVSNGPWKLGGLPGLILEASSADGQYSFVANGLEQKESPIRPIFGNNNYMRTDRMDYLKSKRKFVDNAIQFMKASMGAKLDNMPEIKISENYDLLETDYR